MTENDERQEENGQEGELVSRIAGETYSSTEIRESSDGELIRVQQELTDYLSYDVADAFGDESRYGIDTSNISMLLAVANSELIARGLIGWKDDDAE